MGQNRNLNKFCFTCIFFAIILSPYLSAISFPSCYDEESSREERLLEALIDGHLTRLAEAINSNDHKCSKINTEYIKARAQIYMQKSIEASDGFDFVLKELEKRFVNLSEYDLDLFINNFWPCSSADLLRRLDVNENNKTDSSEKKKLPPRIECGIIASLAGYFMILLPIPPIVRAGWIVLGIGLELVCEGYFQEQDRRYYESNNPKKEDQ